MLETHCYMLLFVEVLYKSIRGAGQRTQLRNSLGIDLVVCGEVAQGGSSFCAQALALCSVHGPQELDQPKQRLPSHLPDLVLAVPA